MYSNKYLGEEMFNKIEKERRRKIGETFSKKDDITKAKINEKRSKSLKSFYKENHPWNYSLTKNNDERILKFANSRRGISPPNKGIYKFRKEKPCLYCGKLFITFLYREHKFCSLDCFFKMPVSEETKQKRSLIMKEKYLNGDIKVPKTTSFYSGRGYRQDINIFVRSRLEANIIRILNYLGEEFKYESKNCRFKIDHSVLILDFYLPKRNIYLEGKGYLREENKIKLKNFVELYPEIAKHTFVIDNEAYKELTKRFKGNIQNWES